MLWVFYIEVLNNLSVTKIEEQQTGQETLPIRETLLFAIRSLSHTNLYSFCVAFKRNEKGLLMLFAVSVRKGSSEVPNYRVSSFEVTYIPFAA